LGQAGGAAAAGENRSNAAKVPVFPGLLPRIFPPQGLLSAAEFLGLFFIHLTKVNADRPRPVQMHLDQLRNDAAECAVLAAEAEDVERRERFGIASQHLTRA